MDNRQIAKVLNSFSIDYDKFVLNGGCFEPYTKDNTNTLTNEVVLLYTVADELIATDEKYGLERVLRLIAITDISSLHEIEFFKTFNPNNIDLNKFNSLEQKQVLFFSILLLNNINISPTESISLMKIMLELYHDIFINQNQSSPNELIFFLNYLYINTRCYNCSNLTELNGVIEKCFTHVNINCLLDHVIQKDSAIEFQITDYNNTSNVRTRPTC